MELKVEAEVKVQNKLIVGVEVDVKLKVNMKAKEKNGETKNCNLYSQGSNLEHLKLKIQN